MGVVTRAGRVTGGPNGSTIYRATGFEWLRVPAPRRAARPAGGSASLSAGAALAAAESGPLTPAEEKDEQLCVPWEGGGGALRCRGVLAQRD